MSDNEQLDNEVTTNEEAQPQQVVQIQRVYVKDVSFEAPNSPEIFTTEWKPSLSVDLNTEYTVLAETVYEITLNITVKTVVDGSDKVAFMCEVQQAGIFTISGLDEMQMAHSLTSACPNMLFPYARELISSLVNKGTFPPLNLNPINFDAYFIEYLQKQEELKQQAEDKPLN